MFWVLPRIMVEYLFLIRIAQKKVRDMVHHYHFLFMADRVVLVAEKKWVAYVA
jgi:hypothetical protein